MKGVILAGGFGTRMQPSTSVTNKHLLPVYSNLGAVPMIYYPITTLKNSGVDDILLVTSRDHAGHMVQVLGDGEDFGVNFTYKIQEMDRTPTGIAQALKLSRDFVGEDNFAVLLGDNFYDDSFADEFASFSREDFDAMIFLSEVDDPERFGVARLNEEGRVIDIEEKPCNPKSNLAVTGLYLYSSNVFELVDDLKPSERGELEISHINDIYAKSGNLGHCNMDGFWSDMGTPESMLRTQEFINRSKK
jgi:glucose-1-phosphate thymidylyltransferase